MTVRTLALPTHLFRWLLAPAIFGALFAAVTSLFRLRVCQPSLPRMSDEWMQSLDRGPDLDSWR